MKVSRSYSDYRWSRVVREQAIQRIGALTTDEPRCPNLEAASRVKFLFLGRRYRALKQLNFSIFLPGCSVSC